MVRVEGIPYKGLDQRYELSRELEIKRKRNEIKAVHDLGNCFYVELLAVNNNTRI